MRPTVHLLDDPAGFVDIVTPKAPQVLSTVPEAALVGADDAGPIVRVRHAQATAELLADLRVPHLPPMVTDYDWKASFEPMPHQFRVAGSMSTHSKFFCLADPGTGKTISTVWAFDYLKRVARLNRVLIIAPLSLLEDTWAKEFRNGAPHLKVVVLHGSAEKRKRLARTPADVYVINYDGVEIVYDELCHAGIDLVVFDESTAIKNINRRWKFCRGVVNTAKWVWELTATPTAQSPEDAYGQIKMVHGDAFPFTATSWRDATMQQKSKFRWVPKPEAAQLVREWMSPAIYVRKADVLAYLPPVMRYRRKVDMSAQQRALMKTLSKEAQATLASGAQITAVHNAALRLKIIQIASGVVYDDAREIIEVDCAPRLAELTDVAKSTRARAVADDTPNNKLLVFCMFKHTVAAVCAHLCAQGIKAVEVTGDTPAGARTKIFSSFQKDNEIEAIVAVPDVMAHGLTLTAASTTVWFTPHSSAEKFIQANNRTDRPGQKYSMEIHELYGCEQERVMYDALDDRTAHQADTLSVYKQLVGLADAIGD